MKKKYESLDGFFSEEKGDQGLISFIAYKLHKEDWILCPSCTSFNFLLPVSCDVCDNWGFVRKIY